MEPAHVASTGKDGEVRDENDELVDDDLFESEGSRMFRLHEDGEDGEGRDEAEDFGPPVVKKVGYWRSEGFEEVGEVS